MSQATEQSNRRLLRAREAMDRTCAEPLDVAALAHIAHTLPVHFSARSEARSARRRIAISNAAASSAR